MEAWIDMLKLPIGATFRDVCHEHEFEGSKASIGVLTPPGARTLVRAVGEEIIIEGSGAWIDMLNPLWREPPSDTSAKNTDSKAWKPGSIC